MSTAGRERLGRSTDRWMMWPGAVVCHKRQSLSRLVPARIANAMKYLVGAVFIDEKYRGYRREHDAAGAAAYLGCVSGQAAPSGC